MGVSPTRGKKVADNIRQESYLSRTGAARGSVHLVCCSPTTVPMTSKYLVGETAYLVVAFEKFLLLADKSAVHCSLSPHWRSARKVWNCDTAICDVLVQSAINQRREDPLKESRRIWLGWQARGRCDIKANRHRWKSISPGETKSWAVGMEAADDVDGGTTWQQRHLHWHMTGRGCSWDRKSSRQQRIDAKDNNWKVRSPKIGCQIKIGNSG